MSDRNIARRENDKRTRPLSVRFWEKVNKTETCWLWTGAQSGPGYGQIYHQGKVYLAHRLLWEIENGPIPTGKELCHKCDVRLCVRPDHLFLGTHSENMLDAVSKGRLHVYVGPANFKTRLSDEDVMEIRKMAACGVTPMEIAGRFRICVEYARKIASGRMPQRLRNVAALATTQEVKP